MGHRVITISEAIGSGGPDIAAALSERLGIRVIDREVLTAAAQEAGVSVEAIEEAEHVPSFLSRMIDLLGRYPVAAEMIGPAGDVPPVPALTSDNYRMLIEDVIRGHADQGDAIILGHGAQRILKEYPNAVRVYVSAPLEARIARVREERELDAEAAEKFVREDDDLRRSFLKEYYKINRNEAQHYDLCVRTDKINFSTAVKIICEAVEQVSG